MSRIRSKNTKPEILVRKCLHSKGFRFRILDTKLPGKPDIVLKKYKAVIFVHGCFWHGHKGCKYFSIPKTRTEWWLTKIQRNKYLDKKNQKLLREDGWNVFEIFECSLKGKKLQITINKLISKLKAIN